MPGSPRSEGVEAEGEERRRSGRLDSSAAMMAHDLRNPLAVARGRLGLAREDVDSPHLDAAARALERIDAIVEDYRLLGVEGSMVVDPEPVDLAAAAEEAWANVPTREASLDVRTGRVIQADGDRVRQLLENLVRNAIEHGGDEVTVTVGDVPDGFFVADDGPGIPPAERGAVLDAGYSSIEGNTGIGLSIASMIVEAHGWELSVANDGGARFEITGVTTAS